MLLPLIFISSRVGAQTDSLHLHLDSTTFVSEKNASMFRIGNDKLTKIDLGQIQSMPKILGNSDPVHFVRLLPGVQTATEYNSSIYIQGCDDAHNEVSVAGVPLFGVNHMLGFFSIFNPEHHSQMSYSASSSSNMLGGTLRMELPDTLEKKISGRASVGLMSSQGSVGIRLGEKSHLRVSARQSYMNLLYKRWLRFDDSSFSYGFGDYNLTYLWNPGSKDKVWVDGYFGMDRTGIGQSAYDLGVSLNWGNYLAAVHWHHNGESVKHKHTLSSSGYKSACDVVHADAQAHLLSFINAAGYKGEVTWKGLRGKAEMMYYRAMPQYPVITGMFNTTSAVKEVQNAFEGTAVIGYEREFAYDWNVKADLKGVLFCNPDVVGAVTPDISLSYNARRYGRVSVSYGWQQQNLFQTGLSNVGLPIEFWFLSGEHSYPQYSQNASLSYDLEFCRSMYAFSVSAYYKQLYNQVEYKGDLFDLFMEEYDLYRNLLKGRGWNYGVTAMLHKQSGNLTGWISYSWGRALRRFNNPEYPGIYPANHERIHELNAVCSYKWRRWDFAGTFIYASGLPFTAPESYYLASGRLIMSYGEHNACRMRPYIRLDLSATYAFKKADTFEHGINLSVYNALSRRNDVLYRLRVTPENKYAYVPMGFLLELVPSVSYYIKF